MNTLLYLSPYLRKDGCIIRIASAQPMHLLTEVAVVVWLRLAFEFHSTSVATRQSKQVRSALV